MAAGNDNPKNHTQPYGGDQEDQKNSQDDGAKDLRAQAEKSVVSQHGDAVRSNPNFERLVKEAEDQISGSAEKHKDW